MANKTPYNVLYLKEVDYSILKVFGCLAYASTIAVHRSKFDPRATPCVFMGYPAGIKGFRLYDIAKKCFFIARDGLFFEHLFPFHTIKTNDFSSSSTCDFLENFVLPMPITESDPPSLLKFNQRPSLLQFNPMFMRFNFQPILRMWVLV